MSKTLKSLADNAYWREQDAREALDELARSGLPLEVFAERRGLGSPRLRRWQARLADTQVEARQAPIVIRVGEASIEVDARR